jgi:hypothetical protein
MSVMRALTTIILVALLSGCNKGEEGGDAVRDEYPEFLTFEVENPSNQLRKDVAVFLPVEKIKAKHPNFNANAFVVFHQQQELASQANDLDGDGNADQIVCVADFAPNETKALTLRYAKSGVQPRQYLKRTQAELSHKVGGKFVNRKYEGGAFQNVQFLRVPPEHTDHSFYIRYEGPGWESDKVGYRFYLDWRNATDIFGKKNPDMVLHNVGLDGFDSYHEMADWGMDILKVGESLGIGSIGMLYNGKVFRVSQTDSVTCEIVANGPVRSQVRTRYFGWQVGLEKYDLVSNLSITAGSRATEHAVEISGNPPNLCTGLAKHEEGKVLQPTNEVDGEWQYFALYGKQSLAGDHLGMAILYKKSDLVEITEDEVSHVLMLQPKDGKLTYFFLAAWEQEPDGIRSRGEFQIYLNECMMLLNNPVQISF